MATGFNIETRMISGGVFLGHGRSGCIRDPVGGHGRALWCGNEANGRTFDLYQPRNDIGLIYMNARYYLPGVGRFLSADVIVPDPMNPQQFNRYSYVLNNPLKFFDPSGHCAYDASGNEDRANDGACWQAYDQAFGLLGSDFSFLAGWQTVDLESLLFWMSSGVSIQNQLGGLWTSSNLSTAISGLNYIQDAISDTGVLRRILGLSHGLALIMCPAYNPGNDNHYYTTGVNSITFDDVEPLTIVEFLHEIGHAVDWNVGSGG